MQNDFDYRATGKVVEVTKEETFEANGKSIRKRTVVICDNPNAEYPRHFAVTFWNARADEAAKAHEGDEVTIDINFNARRWERDGKHGWTPRMNGVALTVAAVEVPEQQAQQATQQQATPPAANAEAEPADDDIPF